MRSLLSSGRTKYLIRTASLLVISSLAAGCSSDFKRFNGSILAEAAPKGAVGNPYPGDLDQTTTSSVKKRFLPMASVGGTNPQAVSNTPRGAYYHQAEPTYIAPASIVTAPAYPDVDYSRHGSDFNAKSSVEVSSLPAPVKALPKPQNLDMVKTSSVREKTSTRIVSSSKSNRLAMKQPASSLSESTKKTGWTRAGGTIVDIQEGEHLFHISKRYGVPESALREANGMSRDQEFQAGQRIVIPNYVYSSKAPVSAPDHNRKKPDVVANVIPRKRPRIISNHEKIIAAPVKKVTRINKPDRSIVTGSIKPSSPAGKGIYTVKSGDSLSKIAALNGVSVTALKANNNIKGSTIRIGQQLNMPDANRPVKLAKAKTNDSFGVDPIVTGIVKTAPAPKTDKIASAPTPKRSGISQFRWPVRGHIVKKFGSQSGSQKNDGIDISVPEGTAVRAVENGIVLYVGEGVEKYGRLVLIRHEDGWVSAYAHNKSYEVSKGDSIRRGQIIARSGRTGDTNRPKLHFELRKNSVPVNPLKHLGSA